MLNQFLIRFFCMFMFLKDINQNLIRIATSTLLNVFFSSQPPAPTHLKYLPPMEFICFHNPVSSALVTAVCACIYAHFESTLVLTFSNNHVPLRHLSGADTVTVLAETLLVLQVLKCFPGELRLGSWFVSVLWFLFLFLALPLSLSIFILNFAP